MFRWSTAKIPDSVMFGELEERIFSVDHKGEVLQAYLYIATGEREKGLQALNDYISKWTAQMQKKGGKVSNLKDERTLKTA